jgi:hypothetical protein
MGYLGSQLELAVRASGTGRVHALLGVSSDPFGPAPSSGTLLRLMLAPRPSRHSRRLGQTHGGDQDDVPDVIDWESVLRIEFIQEPEERELQAVVTTYQTPSVPLPLTAETQSHQSRVVDRRTSVAAEASSDSPTSTSTSFATTISMLVYVVDWSHCAWSEGDGHGGPAATTNVSITCMMHKQGRPHRRGACKPAATHRGWREVHETRQMQGTRCGAGRPWEIIAHLVTRHHH